MKWILLVTFGLPLLAALGFSAFVRLAPTDAARWHVSLAASPRSIKPNDAAAYPGAGAPDLALPPAALAQRIADIALAEPRTAWVAGSVAEGQMTFVQRSALWGFPDFITVEVLPTATGSTLRIWSRSRFGYSDMGVNAARLERWLGQVVR